MDDDPLALDDIDEWFASLTDDQLKTCNVCHQESDTLTEFLVDDFSLMVCNRCRRLGPLRCGAVILRSVETTIAVGFALLGRHQWPEVWSDLPY